MSFDTNLGEIPEGSGVAEYQPDDFSSARSVEIAAQKGYSIRYPEPREIFLDLDSEGALEHFKKWRHILPPNSTVSHSASKTPGHSHTIVNLPAFTMTNVSDKLLLAAILGSDLRFVAISYKRHLAGDPHPVLFFELPA